MDIAFIKRFIIIIKILELSDEESFKKENISMESEIKELNNLEAKIIDLKSKIEIEINEINILYEKALDDVTKSFEMKHEILYKEENDIKE